MTAGAILFALALATGVPAPSPTPFARAEDRAVGYEGPGREAPPVPGLAEVKLGWFGPDDPAHPEGGSSFQGATLAVEEVNAEGGSRGVPFRLVPAWSDSPWTGGAPQAARLVYRDEVWAIVGSIDGAATHVAEQLAVKARVVVLGPGGTDETVNLANVPWMLSLLPSDAAQAPRLVDALSAAAAGGPFAVVSATDHDSRAAWAAFRAELGRRKLSPAVHLELSAGEPRLAEVASAVAAARPRAVLVVASARTAGRLVRALRDAGHSGAVLGGAPLGRSGFREEAGAAAEGALFPLLVEPAPAWDAFAGRFRERFGRDPDYAAGSAYDAIRLLAAAVGRAGPNRPRILDALRSLSPWAGVSGEIRFDALGRNQRPVGLGTIRAGRVVPLPAGR